MKRSLSPAVVPLPKAPHTTRSSHPCAHLPVTFDQVFVDELVLVIFSFLSASDICVAQAVNRNWSRVALDNQLWKGLFGKVFGNTGRMRGSKGFHSPSVPEGRDIKPLPSRARGAAAMRQDFKRMYRISSNWEKGRCSVNSLLNGDAEPSPTQGTSRCSHLVMLAGQYTISATTNATKRPEIALFDSTLKPHQITSSKLIAHPANSICSICIDQSAPAGKVTLRIAVCYSSGALSVFTVTEIHSQPTECHLIQAHRAPPSHSALHGSTLVTLASSPSCQISIFSIGTTITKTRVLNSFSSFPPTSLILSQPTSGQYKALVSYATPVYPHHWSLSTTQVAITETGEVASSRTNRALEVAEDFEVIAEDDVDQLVPSRLRRQRDQWSRKLLRVVATQSDGKWAIIAGGDNHDHVIQVYRIWQHQSLGYVRTLDSTIPGLLWTDDDQPETGVASSVSPSIGPLVDDIFKHHAVAPAPPGSRAIAALAIADGRCVSLSRDGTFWVWDLESGRGAQARASPPQGSCRISFDDTRVLVASGSGVEVLNFDI